mmetsp:Transcript_50201/g.155145  ORF Transcript_50201/g.155145 Transcript_50201/m.155145 type:complete len:445 (-) Transcript_50201:16-1350(-)
MESSCPFDELVRLFEWCHLPGLPQVITADVDMRFDVRRTPDGKPRGTHSRFASLASHIMASEVWGSMGLLAAIMAFADAGALGGLKSYLKIAGSRADKFMDAIRSRPSRGAEVAVEYGAFIGTTTIRLADHASKHAPGPATQRTVQVLSFEVEPVHLVMARWMVDLAGLSWAAEVWPGMGSDAARRASDEFGQLSWRVAFFDHRGTKYHEDLAQLEWLRVLAPGALVIADNVLRPGAPQFLWHVHSSAAYRPVTWAFVDNTPFPGEDWLTVAALDAAPSEGAPWPPPHLERLAWDSDRWRRKGQEGGLRAGDWSAFARHAAEELAQCGIEARPWSDPNAPPLEEEGEGETAERERAAAEGAWAEALLREPAEGTAAQDAEAGGLGRAAADVDASAGCEGPWADGRGDAAGAAEPGEAGIADWWPDAGRSEAAAGEEEEEEEGRG